MEENKGKLVTFHKEINPIVKLGSVSNILIIWYLSLRTVKV